MTKFVDQTGKEHDLDLSPKTFEEAVASLRNLELRCHGKIKITRCPRARRS